MSTKLCAFRIGLPSRHSRNGHIRFLGRRWLARPSPHAKLLPFLRHFVAVGLVDSNGRPSAYKSDCRSEQHAIATALCMYGHENAKRRFARSDAGVGRRTADGHVRRSCWWKTKRLCGK